MSGAADGSAGDHRDRWLISYADLVTLLFSLFVVLYAAADESRARAVQSAINAQISGAPSSPPGRMPGGRGVLPGADSLLDARDAVARALSANDSLRTRTRMTEVERGFIVSLAEAGFFDPGDAAVRPEADALLDSLAETLKSSQALVRVEGHTDSTPIATLRYPSNWELSSARASAVLARLVARGVPAARISVAGYAGERPVADNDTPAGRALNRRVDLVVLQAQ
ncbi:MAG: OmpA family protein [Blastocatellia bacterium]|nr:OmpA family protein [Blastocatellia bacterium]